VPILFNAAAGPIGRAEFVEEVADRLVRAGLHPEIIPDRERFANLAGMIDAADRWRALAIAGGDGTAMWAANLRSPVPLALLPIGSENLLARHLGVRRDAALVAEMIVSGRTRALDAGTVNGARFNLMASVGLDSEVVWHVHRNRRGHVSKFDYAWEIVRVGGSARLPRIRVHLDGEAEPRMAAHVFVFNSPEYALGLPLCPGARSDDGLLDVVLFRRPGLWSLLRYGLSVLLGRHASLRDVEVHRVRTVRLWSRRPAVIQADGDPLGPLPAELGVEPTALTFLVP
jgi:diacylglycerol kinase family enzyme